MQKKCINQKKKVNNGMKVKKIDKMQLNNYTIYLTQIYYKLIVY